MRLSTSGKSIGSRSRLGSGLPCLASTIIRLPASRSTASKQTACDLETINCSELYWVSDHSYQMVVERVEELDVSSQVNGVCD